MKACLVVDPSAWALCMSSSVCSAIFWMVMAKSWDVWPICIFIRIAHILGACAAWLLRSLALASAWSEELCQMCWRRSGFFNEKQMIRNHFPALSEEPLKARPCQIHPSFDFGRVLVLVAVSKRNHTTDSHAVPQCDRSIWVLLMFFSQFLFLSSTLWGPFETWDFSIFFLFLCEKNYLFCKISIQFLWNSCVLTGPESLATVPLSSSPSDGSPWPTLWEWGRCEEDIYYSGELLYLYSIYRSTRGCLDASRHLPQLKVRQRRHRHTYVREDRRRPRHRHRRWRTRKRFCSAVLVPTTLSDFSTEQIMWQLTRKWRRPGNQTPPTFQVGDIFALQWDHRHRRSRSGVPNSPWLSVCLSLALFSGSPIGLWIPYVGHNLRHNILWTKNKIHAISSVRVGLESVCGVLTVWSAVARILVTGW